MKGWIEGFQASIDYIEQHLLNELDIEKIAKKLPYLPSTISGFSALYAV